MRYSNVQLEILDVVANTTLLVMDVTKKVLYGYGQLTNYN
jgi:hypothetical protein